MSVRMFAYFCGIWDYRDKIYNEQITFVLYAMQCLSKSKDVSCLFPDEGNFWVKPLGDFTEALDVGKKDRQFLAFGLDLDLKVPRKNG